MTFSTLLRLLPLLLLLACESRPDTATVAVQNVKTPKPSLPKPRKPGRALMQTFTWQDEACTSTGSYKTGTYTSQQLRDTYQLVNGFLITTTVAPFYLKHYNDAFFRHAAKHLAREHDSLASVLHGLDVVPTPFWRKIKRLREAELAESYALDQAALDGYFQPASWLSNRYYAHCSDYATALASTDTAVVIKAWRKLVDAEKINNGIPEELAAAFTAEVASPERLRYAKVALMTFGWSNCANAQRKYPDLSDQYSLYANFTKLFTRIRQSDCVDVD